MTKSMQIQTFASVKQKVAYFNKLALDQHTSVSTVNAVAVSNAIQTPKTLHTAPITAKLVKQKQKQQKVQIAVSLPLPKKQIAVSVVPLPKTQIVVSVVPLPKAQIAVSEPLPKVQHFAINDF